MLTPSTQPLFLMVYSSLFSFNFLRKLRDHHKLRNLGEFSIFSQMSSFCNGPQIHPLSMFLNLFDQILALEGHFCLDELTNEFLNRNAKIPTAHVQSFTPVLLGQFPHLLPPVPSVHVGQHPCFVAGPRADCGHRTVVGQLCF